jgi:hypothetical protein
MTIVTNIVTAFMGSIPNPEAGSENAATGKAT